MANKQAARGASGGVVRLVLPFVAATVVGVIVFVATAGNAAPVYEGGTPRIDPGQGHLINSVLAGLAALLVTAIAVRMKKPKRKAHR
jgi:hypothetical protein